MRGTCTCAALLIIVLLAPSAAGQGLVQRWPWPEDPTPLLVNGGFELLDAQGKAVGWSWNTGAWSIIDDAGSKALLLKDSNLQPYYSIAGQKVTVPTGYYSLRGHVRTENVTTGAARVQAVLTGQPAPGASGNLLTGTGQGTSQARMFPISAGDASVQAYGYGKPDGSIYFDDIALIRHVPPSVEAFLLYPNYQGRLWNDGPAQIRLAVRGTGTGAVVLRGADGAVLASQPVTLTDAWQPVTLDATALFDGHYRVGLEVAGANDRPEYALVRGPRAPGVRVEPDLVWVQPGPDGQPRRLGLPVLVYHTSGYPVDAAGWTTQLAPFDMLKYDIYLNYWLGKAPLSSLLGLGQALAAKGRLYFDTINDFYLPGVDTTGGGNQYPTGPTATPDGPRTLPRATGLNGQPGIGGWYTADELPAQGFWGVWAQRVLLREAAPLMPSLGTQGNMTLGRLGQELVLARDLLDVVSVDPYPVRGNNTNPDGSHKLEEVADFTAAAVAAVQDARPVWTTIQFWGNLDRAALGFRWPSQQELLDMSYLAVCAGARGLNYWSLGARALAWVAEPTRTQKFQELVATVDELKRLDPVLLGQLVALPTPLAAGLIGVARRTGTTVTTIACNRTAAPVDGLRAYGHRITTTEIAPPPSPTPGPATLVIEGSDAAGSRYRVTIEPR